MESVYFVNGFLDAGKTTFIRDLINRDVFKIPGKTLILLCEEGDMEYDENELKELNTVIETIQEEEDFNEEYISTLEKHHRPVRIIVEFNGMWDRKNTKFPWYWEDIMEIAVFDATTFKLYSDNMRAFVAEQVRNAELVIFYQAHKVRDQLAIYARNIKAINIGAAFVFRGDKGDIILNPDENLPYDINSDYIELDEVGFAIMCMDSLERFEVYEGKKVHFIAQAYKMKDGSNFEFIAGRLIMTCCEADMSFMGIICGYEKAYELENKKWVEVTGIIRVVHDDEMNRQLPVCRVLELSECTEPESEYVSII